MISNPYQTLGVSRGASAEEIRKRYRTLCLEYHPDRNPNDSSAEEKFKEVSSAYQILSNPDKRRSYELGHDVFTNPDAQEVIQQFMRFFGEFVDASPLFANTSDDMGEPKKNGKPKGNKKRKKNAPRRSPKMSEDKAQKEVKCSFCHDTKTMVMRQGGFEVRVPCQRCPAA